MNRDFIVLIIVTVFFSCKKNNEVKITESEVRYEINGVPFQLKSKTEITFSFVGIIQTVGDEKPTNWLSLRTPQLLIQVKDFTFSNPITIGIYSGKTYDNDGNIKGVELSYLNDSTEFYESSFNNPNTEVKIESIGSNGVKGTFRGWVINNQDTLKLENGTFSIYTYK